MANTARHDAREVLGDYKEMRFACLSLALVATALTAVPAAAQSTNPNQAQQNERRICRNQVDGTGSILGGRRVCRTAAEWRQIEEDARSNLERSRPTVRPGE